MREEREFVGKDVKYKKPADVVVGDFFIFEKVKYTVVAIDWSLLYYSFVGYRFENGQGTAQMITNHHGTKHTIRKIED